MVDGRPAENGSMVGFTRIWSDGGNSKGKRTKEKGKRYDGRGVCPDLPGFGLIGAGLYLDWGGGGGANPGLGWRQELAG